MFCSFFKSLNKRRLAIWPPFCLCTGLIILFTHAQTFADPAGRWGGIFNLTSGDEKWQDANGSLMIDAALSLIVLQDEKNTIFMGTTKGLYKNADNGANWEKISAEIGTHILTLASSGLNIYAGTEKGMFISKDIGKSWKILTNMDKIGKIINIYIHPKDKDVLLISTLNGAFKSIDRGWTWSPININLPQGTIANILVEPNSPWNIYLTTTAVIYRSSDSGNSWKQLKNGLSPDNNIFALAFDPKDSKRLYLMTDIGIFISKDNGERWEHIINEREEVYYFPKVYSLIVDPINSERLYAGTADGLFVSNDKGRNWEVIKKGLPSHLQVGKIVTDPNDGKKIFLVMSTIPYKLVWEREIDGWGIVLKSKEIIYLAVSLIIMVLGAALTIYKFRGFYKRA